MDSRACFLNILQLGKDCLGDPRHHKSAHGNSYVWRVGGLASGDYFFSSGMIYKVVLGTEKTKRRAIQQGERLPHCTRQRVRGIPRSGFHHFPRR